ncbi:MAG: type I-E CRISPR-associated protein Cas6/Cse3/CasE [Desulfobacteraceae bacterium]|nr:type I-E CRISPR-associated protein Cas6/Cse3/CasE [Desulfobacteraceae bacterium]
MFLSKIQIRTGNIDPEKLVAFLGKDGYGLHQMIWALFPNQPDAKRDFIYRRDDKQGWPCFYVVSARRPENVQGLFSVDTKEYQPRLKEGDRLGFSLRVNPVVTKKNENGQRSRHDVVMDSKRGLKAVGSDIFMPEVIRNAGLTWLSSRSERCGFSFDSSLVTVEGYYQHQMTKSKGSKPIRFSTLDFEGIFTVENTNEFTRMLFTGIGPAKAFGCGLMLVRRI